ncbi:MAG: succinylglutamate desuccinylase/aspartoacylase family protein [Acidobacteria bacterium]|nr:succinylglutamate desuccinylase/aspartoacylase family protein [Acidobacteriota bacterium]
MRVATVCLLFTFAVVGRAVAQEPLRVGPVTAAPGTVASGTLEVPPRGGDQGTTLPVTVVNGSKPGPVLALVAGVHGQEYTPVLALQRLRTAIDPASLSGAVIMVHVANMPSYLARTIYYSPADGKNLNRVFPGRADGTLSERIADVITREVIDRATHVVDLHCGDGNESLRPYTYWITTGPPDVAEAGRQMALAFGMDRIVVDRERPVDPKASVYLSNTGVTRGKPALTIESGGMAQTDNESIARIERGVAGLLRHLKMRADGPAPVTKPVLFDRSEVVRSNFTGIFYGAVEKGQTVAAGAVIGRVTDFHGKVLEEFKAPFAGEVLYIIGTPAMNKGEPVVFIAATR